MYIDWTAFRAASSRRSVSMGNRSVFRTPTGETRRFFVGGPPGHTQIDPSGNVKRLLFDWAIRLSMIVLSALLKAEVVMARFSDKPVSGFVSQKNIFPLAPFGQVLSTSPARSC